MKVILDAMGGDLAPEAAVLGALEAHREFGTEITLVGRGAEILEVMGIPPPSFTSGKTPL